MGGDSWSGHVSWPTLRGRWTMDQELLRNEYLAAENRILRVSLLKTPKAKEIPEFLRHLEF